jgi:hypothetical protein
VNKQERIISIFREMGGATTLRLAQECIRQGVFDEEELERASLRWAQGICREAIKQIHPITGLPFAGPTRQKITDNDKGREWRQITLMDYDDLAFNIEERANGLWADYSVLVKMRDYCFERFGRTPQIPILYGKPSSEVS